MKQPRGVSLVFVFCAHVDNTTGKGTPTFQRVDAGMSIHTSRGYHAAYALNFSSIVGARIVSARPDTVRP